MLRGMGTGQQLRVFGPPHTKKMVHAWRQQEDKLKTVNKSKHNLHCPCPQWPELEDDVKKWVVDERSSGRCVSTKMILNETRRVAEERRIQNFVGTKGWCYRFMKLQGLSMRTKTSIAQKMP